jgi:hypothetical protein
MPEGVCSDVNNVCFGVEQTGKTIGRSVRRKRLLDLRFCHEERQRC